MFPFTFRFLLASTFFLCITGCGSQSRPAPTSESNIRESFRKKVSEMAAKPPVRQPNEVAPGFEISLVSAEDTKLNGSYRIKPDGKLELPYDIVINSTGMSEKALKEKITQAYKSFFQSEPSIQISVLSREYWVSVSGLVQKPGQYLVRNDSTLDEVIAMAGGLQGSSAAPGAASAAVYPQYVRIHQGDYNRVFKLSDYYSGEVSLAINWIGGDKLFFQSERGDVGTTTGVEQNYVQMLGQVRTPGEYTYRPDADFFHYLIRAGGPGDRADLYNITILRGDGEQNRMINFSSQDPDSVPSIQGGDVVIVHADNPTKAEKEVRFVGDIASILGTLATIALLFVTT